MTGSNAKWLPILLMVLLTAPALSFVQSGSDFESENRPNRFWVHRRDKDDGDPSGAKALVIKIGDSDPVNKTVSVKIWKYLGYSGGAYTRAGGGTAPPVILATGCVDKTTSDNSRKRETITIKVGEDIIGFATLYRGKNRTGKGNGNVGRGQQRLVFRWKPSVAMLAAQNTTEQESAAQKKQTEVSTDPCDDPPNDDPMEEEPLGNDPPDPLPDPPPDP